MGNAGMSRTGWLRRSLAVIAAAIMIGLCLAGTAQAGPSQVAGQGVIHPAVSVSGESAPAAAKECFYTIPSCSSSNPSVNFSIVSVGNTSGCTSKDTVEWGDKSSTTKTYRGGPNGSTLVAFDHTYKDGPRRYTITITGETVSGDCGTLTGATLYFTLPKTTVHACAAGTTLSGPAWASKFPYSKNLDELKQPFRAGVIRFIAAMKHAGIKEGTVQTFRPAKRAYLMHYAWMVAHRKTAPQNVPAFPDAKPRKGSPYPGTVGICWVHHTSTGAVDLAASIKAAAQMLAGYHIDPKYKSAPAYPTQHSVGLAIDMTTTWTAKKITIVNARGKDVTISTTPHSGLNRQLIAVGATYGVIHFTIAAHDPNHWSSNGS